jgi:hypothetical protein
VSTYADNRRRQQRLRGTNQKSTVQDRIGAFLNFLAGPVTYNQDVVDARVKAMERGSKIPFLPEFGLSEGFQTYNDRASADLKTAFGDTSPTPDPAPETPQPLEVTDKLRELAFEKKAPGTTPESLKDYYSAQKAVGAAEKEGLSAAFGGDTPMGKWAEANPDLALRLLQKREAKGMATVMGKEVPLEEEATVEMSPMERIKFIQGGFR